MADDIIDEIVPSTAMLLMGNKGEPPMACCPYDDEPLICTMRWAGAEFYCVTCERKYGFLSPKPMVETPELTARYEVLKAIFAERFPAAGVGDG